MISHSFERAAFEGKLGQVLKPVLSPYGWHLIFVQDHRRKVVKKLDQARDQIKSDLMAKHLRRAKFRLIKQLRSEAKIQLKLTP